MAVNDNIKNAVTYNTEEPKISVWTRLKEKLEMGHTDNLYNCPTSETGWDRVQEMFSKE